MGQAHIDLFWNYYELSYLKAKVVHSTKRVQRSGS